jgi:hypothetical protein
MQINGFSNAKFVVMNNYGQFVTSVSDTTCPGTGMSAYTKKLVFGANTDVDAYFNNTNSGVIPYKNGVIVSTSEVIKFTTTGISNGQISLTFDRSNDSNTYAAENNYRLNFDVVVKNGTTYSPTSNLVNRDFNYSRLGDTLFEISDVSNFVYIMENSSSRPRINAVPVFDFSSSIYGNNYTPTNLTDPYLVNALNVSYNSDLAN